MAYETYHLRAPDVQTFLEDAKAPIKEAGIDPYEKSLLRIDENNNDVPGQGVDVIPAGRWYKTDPTYDSHGKITDSGTLGDYALINIRTKDPEVKAVVESFESSDSDKQPGEIPDHQAIGGGTHRIDSKTIDNPVRVFATVEQ
jgi:hypothetical protein